jgi:hypothetical protein
MLALLPLGLAGSPAPGGATVAAPPANLFPPSVLGAAVVGSELEATPGGWGGRVPSLSFSWERCDSIGACAPIAGASASSYTVATADLGSLLRVLVGARTAAGVASATSPPTAAVAAAQSVGAVPAASLVAPEQLLVDQVQVTPAPLTSHNQLLRLRVHISDTNHESVAGVLVYALPLPASWASPSPEELSNAEGWTTLTLRPLPALPLTSGGTLAVLVRARSAANASSAGLDALRLLQVRLGAARASLYLSGATGYDISFPNCREALPASGGFWIIGVNGGRPLTTNRCFQLEYTHSQTPGGSPLAVYLNTGYSRSLLGRVTPACRAAAAATRLATARARAYALGCSEGEQSLQALAGLPAPAAVWLDVETSNAWSTATALNVSTLQGLIDTLDREAPATTIGIYSNRRWWHRITRDWQLPALPEWLPDPDPSCPTGFAGGPVWLRQGGTTRIDIDHAC